MLSAEIKDPRGIHFGQHLIEQGLVTEVDVLEALEIQKSREIPFEKIALEMRYLNMKQIYQILTYQVDTTLSFENVALKKGYLRKDEANVINEYISKYRPMIGNILVEQKKIKQYVLERELEGFGKLTKYYQKAAAFLKHINIFSNLADNTLLALSYISKMLIHKAGEIVLKEGEKAEHFYCVVSGTLRITKDNPNKEGKEIYITNIGEHEVFGEACILEGGIRTANVIAETDVVLIVFNRYDFIEFIKNNPQAALKFLLMIIQRLMLRLGNTNKELAFDRREFSSQDEIDNLIDSLFD
ncbi:MAG: cyclic nucleotide-binding domain-containing protein [Candidatus Magnetoovum sp. WYHC-5]|nr:cyclic nucleotide-binding domain-containing protein [Candidatus Magnetoovum sp. WYHC-5]